MWSDLILKYFAFLIGPKASEVVFIFHDWDKKWQIANGKEMLAIHNV